MEGQRVRISLPEQMARQFMSALASSACAERLFSSDAKMYDDLKKSTNEATLESQLIANRNYPDAWLIYDG